LADEPTSSVTYLLEDEFSGSHWDRYLILLIIVAGIGVAGWHWRGELRAYVMARLAQRPSSNQSEQLNAPEAPPSTPAPVSTSGSEVAPGMPNAGPAPIEKPITGASDTLPAAQKPATATNSATDNNQPPSTPASVAAPPAPTQDNPVPPATEPAAKVEQQRSEETESAKEEAPKEKPTPAKRLKSKVKEAAPVDADADQLEAQGEKYLYGTGAPASCSRAQADLQAAAEQGNGKADSVLGTMYATGHCVPRDLALAYRWFARALQKDPSNARLQRDLQVLWNQMSASERQIAMRR
jgi:hypothetical protein